MSTETNKDVIRRHWNLVNERRLEEAFELAADGSTWQYMTEMPGIGGVKDKAAEFGNVSGNINFFKEGPTFEVAGLTAEEDRVAAELRSQGVFQNGAEMRQQYHILYEVRNDLIQAARVYLDSNHFREILEGPAAAGNPGS